MTSYLFTPSSTANFQFQPTLDGQQYNVIATWNVFGSRYYINIYTLSGALVYTMPLIGSPPGFNISLLPQLNPYTGVPWTSSMYFSDDLQTFVVSP